MQKGNQQYLSWTTIKTNFLHLVNSKENSQQATLGCKKIWKYLLANKIMIIVEYSTIIIIVKPDWEFRHEKSSTEWKLLPEVFNLIVKTSGEPIMNLTA